MTSSTKAETKASLFIKASPEAIWEYASDFEGHWTHGHEGVKVVSEEKDLKDGLVYEEEERIGRLFVETRAEIYDVIPNRQFKWKGRAVYHFLGLTVPIVQGGTFLLEPMEGGTKASHNVWGDFSNTRWGSFIKWFAFNILNIERSVYKQAFGELQEFKDGVEQESV